MSYDQLLWYRGTIKIWITSPVFSWFWNIIQFIRLRHETVHIWGLRKIPRTVCNLVYCCSLVLWYKYTVSVQHWPWAQLRGAVLVHFLEPKRDESCIGHGGGTIFGPVLSRSMGPNGPVLGPIQKITKWYRIINFNKNLVHFFKQLKIIGPIFGLCLGRFWTHSGLG